MLLQVREMNELVEECESSCSSVLGLEALEGVDLEVLHEGVELFLGILVLVLLSADSHTDLAGHVSNALAPNESVEAGVNADVLLHSYVVIRYGRERYFREQDVIIPW